VKAVGGGRGRKGRGGALVRVVENWESAVCSGGDAGCSELGGFKGR